MDKLDDMVYNGYNKTKEADIMNKKFYMIVRDEYGNVIFNHKSDKAKKLIALYNKEAFSTDGNMYQRFYFGTKETNVTDDIFYAVSCGKDI